ncbi:DPA1 protein, partial [Amia calva]|nr:DPA1 protein [Amia calva]
MSKTFSQNYIFPTDPPDVMVYPRNMLELETPNTLICAIKNFHPMDVKVTWTKNNHPVSEGVRQTELLSNEDFTFNMFSFLTFTPELGDIYSCQVEHSALPQVLTRLWEVVIQTKTTSAVSVTVFCGAGLTFGLLGVAAGTFFLIKGNNCE